MRPRAWALALLVLGMAIHLAALVLAEETRVILLGPSLQHPLVVRMRDELKVLGVEVEVEVVSPGEAPLDLAAIGHRHGAAAVARVETAPPEIFLWIDPARGAGAAASAELRVSESVEGPMEPGLLPLRAVELLRGRLIPVTAGATLDEAGPRAIPSALFDVGRGDAGGGDAGEGDAGEGDAEAPPGSPSTSASALPPGAAPPAPGAGLRRAAEPSGRLSLHLAAAVMLSPGGVPAAPQARFGATWSPLSRIGLEAMVFVPTTASTVSFPEGAVNLRVVDFGADFRGLLTEPGATLSIAAGLGLGAMGLFFDGEAIAPYVAVKGSRWVPAPYGVLTATYRLAPRLALRADILGALARPEPVVRVIDREAASFGQPAVFLSLGVEVRP